MKKYLKIIAISAISLCCTSGLKAQYLQIASQLANMMSPALSGSFSYKGFVDVSYLQGVGKAKLNIAGVSTSQGFKYSSWLYMGAGIGVDVAMAQSDDDYRWNLPTRKTGIMVPVFTDFRFNVGKATSTSFYADIRIGASFLMGDRYLAIGDNLLTNRNFFYLKPSVGVRIPLSQTGKKAMNVGLAYQLLTSNNWYYSYYGNPTINSVGAMVSFDW